MATPASTLTPQQQEARKGRITSTRIVKLVKGNALAVFNEMEGLAPPVKDNPRMRFGRALERTIIEAAAEDRLWSPVKYQPGTVIRGDYATSVDALVGDVPERVIEAKNRGGERAQEYAAGEPLEDELVQVQWHMLVTGIPESSVCVLLGGNDLRIFDVKHDPELAAGLTEIADRFLVDHIRTGRPPPMDASDSAAEYLRARFPVHRAPMLVADATLEEWAAELRHLRGERDSYEALTTEMENRIKATLGEAEGVAGSFGRISWKATKGTASFNWDAAVTGGLMCLLEENGFPRNKFFSLWEQVKRDFTVTKPGARRFLCTWSKE